MWTLIIILLIAWLAISVLGLVIEGLLWLALIGILLFLGTSLFGFIRNRTR